MKKEEIFADVLTSVTEATGLTAEEVLRSRKEECADARFILVKNLCQLLPTTSVAEMMGITSQGVRCILHRTARDNFWVQSNCKEIRKQLESKYFTPVGI